MRARPCHSDTSPSLSGTSSSRCGVPPLRRRTPAFVSGTPRQWPRARGSELGCTEPISAACRAHGSAREPQRPGAGTHWAKAEAQALGAWLGMGDAPPRESGTPHGKRCVSPWMGGGRHPRACAQDTARDRHHSSTMSRCPWMSAKRSGTLNAVKDWMRLRNPGCNSPAHHSRCEGRRHIRLIDLNHWGLHHCQIVKP